MIEERALVVAVGKDEAWVETQRRTACGSCSASMSCGTATLAKVLGKRRSQVRVLATMPLRAGDEVMIGIKENALVKGSLAVYLVPLLLMFSGALAGELITQAEGLTIVFSMLGFLGGLAWLRTFTRSIRTDTRFQPVVLCRLTPGQGHWDRALLP
jgi:sigma-E factor negative regulatory protein RseC